MFDCLMQRSRWRVVDLYKQFGSAIYEALVLRSAPAYHRTGSEDAREMKSAATTTAAAAAIRRTGHNVTGGSTA